MENSPKAAEDTWEAKQGGREGWRKDLGEIVDLGQMPNNT